MINRNILPLILLLFCVACQPNSDAALPSLMPTFSVPSALPATPTARIFSTLAEIPMLTPESASPEPPEVVTPDLSETPPPAIPTADTASLVLTATEISPPAQTDTLVFGVSAEGRDLTAYRIGDGARAVLLVGAVHGGFESNTAQLLDALVAHFRANPSALPADITLWVIPMLNPDGVARGRVLEGRFNANAVDLNRNWPCGWQPVAYFRDRTVSAGAEPLSEPETKALSDLVISLQPAATLFFHAAAAGVFAGTCGGDAGSAALSMTYGDAAGYSYGETFSAYPVTGTAPAWVNSLGLAAADVELASATEIEFDRNLAGVNAALCWVSEATC